MKKVYKEESNKAKTQKKLIMIVILSISILFGMLTNEEQAVNENINSTNNETTQISSNTTNTTSTTTTKSSNANLSDLGITPYDFNGFKYGTTSYEVTVPESTETVEIYAKTQNANATVTGTGMKSLEKGENKVEVVVTAEDGTKKTYTINIIREVQQEKYGDTEKIENSNGLEELKINDLSLSPEFKTDIYEYTVKYIGEDTKLNIETTPTSTDYIIEVVGNEDLQEGENTITILVSESNGNNVATYQIIVNKSLIDEEAIAREEAEKKEQQKKIIIGAITVAVILAIIVFIIIRHKRNRSLEEEFSGTDFYDIDDYDDDDYEEEYEEEKETKRKIKHKGKRFK